MAKAASNAAYNGNGLKVLEEQVSKRFSAASQAQQSGAGADSNGLTAAARALIVPDDWDSSMACAACGLPGPPPPPPPEAPGVFARCSLLREPVSHAEKGDRRGAPSCAHKLCYSCIQVWSRAGTTAALCCPICAVAFKGVRAEPDIGRDEHLQPAREGTKNKIAENTCKRCQVELGTKIPTHTSSKCPRVGALETADAAEAKALAAAKRANTAAYNTAESHIGGGYYASAAADSRGPEVRFDTSTS